LNVTEIDELLTSLNGISFPDEWDGGLLCMPANRKVVEGWFYKHHERLREIERKTENIIAGECHFGFRTEFTPEDIAALAEYEQSAKEPT